MKIVIFPSKAHDCFMSDFKNKEVRKFMGQANEKSNRKTDINSRRGFQRKEGPGRYLSGIANPND